MQFMELINSNFTCFDSAISKDFVTDAVWSLDPIVPSDRASWIIITIMCFLFIFVGIPWNLTVIIIIIKKKMCAEEPIVVLLLNLALTDLILCIYIIPFNLVPGISGEFRFGSSDAVRCMVCQAGVIFVLLQLVLLNNFALMSVDRLIYIKWAIHYYRVVQPWKVVVVVICVWIVSIVTAIPPVFGFGELQFSTAVGFCTIKFSGSSHLTKNIYYLGFLLFFILIPLLALVVSNSWVIFIVQRHIRQLYKNTKDQKKQFRKSLYLEIKKKHNNVQLNLIKMYTAIFITFIVTWTPLLIRLLIGLGNENLEFTSGVRIMGSLAYIMLLSQVVIYPSLMAVLIPEVRKQIIELTRAVKKSRDVKRMSSMTPQTSVSSMRSLARNISVVEL